jgi:hypothetical protein
MDDNIWIARKISRTMKLECVEKMEHKWKKNPKNRHKKRVTFNCRPTRPFWQIWTLTAFPFKFCEQSLLIVAFLICLIDRYRVARWYIFKPKIPNWANLEGPCNGRCWYILWPFSLLYGYFVYAVVIMVYFVVIWSIFPRFGMFYREKSGNPG